MHFTTIIRNSGFLSYVSIFSHTFWFEKSFSILIVSSDCPSPVTLDLVACSILKIVSHKVSYTKKHEIRKQVDNCLCILK